MKATQKHIACLKDDVEKWNRFRKLYKIVEVDLSEADLSRANLSNSDLSNSDLSRANLSRANLSNSDLSFANLSFANLSESNLFKASLSEACLFKVELSYAKGIVIFNKPNGRTCYAIKTGETFMIQAGCFWGTIDDFEAAAKNEYGDCIAENYSVQIEYLRSILKIETIDNNEKK